MSEIVDRLSRALGQSYRVLDQDKLITMLDRVEGMDPGLAAITDLRLTFATSYVLMHEGLGLTS